MGDITKKEPEAKEKNAGCRQCKWFESWFTKSVCKHEKLKVYSPYNGYDTKVLFDSMRQIAYSHPNKNGNCEYFELKETKENNTNDL